MHQELQCFMYHSELAPTAELSCVADIVKTARDFNQLHAITGVLIFDGQRFAQYIEGEAQAIDFLIGQLARDPRHINFTPPAHWTTHRQALVSELVNGLCTAREHRSTG